MSGPWFCPYCPAMLASSGMVDAHIIQAHRPGGSE